MRAASSGEQPWSINASTACSSISQSPASRAARSAAHPASRRRPRRHRTTASNSSKGATGVRWELIVGLASAAALALPSRRSDDDSCACARQLAGAERSEQRAPATARAWIKASIDRRRDSPERLAERLREPRRPVLRNAAPQLDEPVLDVDRRAAIGDSGGSVHVDLQHAKRIVGTDQIQQYVVAEIGGSQLTYDHKMLLDRSMVSDQLPGSQRFPIRWRVHHRTATSPRLAAQPTGNGRTPHGRSSTERQARDMQRTRRQATLVGADRELSPGARDWPPGRDL
jgi:hypothetical protein